MKEVLLEIKNINKSFKQDNNLFSKKEHPVLKNISLTIYKNEILGLIGESGSGKTTLGRILVGLEKPTSGTIEYKGSPLLFEEKEHSHNRDSIQMIFQDIYNSFNPTMSIKEILQEPLGGIASTKEEKLNEIKAILSEVGLSEKVLNSKPDHLSGGQRQRIGIARVLLMNPEFIVSDEPVSALDVSVQAQVLNLMKQIQQQSQLANLFISHDLGVVKYVCDRVAIMKEGEIVEINTCEEIFKNPQHEYTRYLLDSVPRLRSSF